jgi:beta-glucosidase
MATRVLRAIFAQGVADSPVPASAPIDFAAHEAVSQADEEQAIVLLKNDGNLLPLAASARSILVIGSHADKGVLAGSGSSLVYPRGGNAAPGIQPTGWPGPVLYHPSSPMKAIAALAPGANVTFVDGADPAAAAAAAKDADIAIVFAHQWTGESFDAPLQLQEGQDALIEAVASANPRTAVVLETGGPILMPWAARVPAILEAWYPGSGGGPAIANVLFGKVNPSGHLPVTFPADEAQLPRPVRPGTGLGDKQMFSVPYSEGAAVGYKWFDAKKLQPLFPFGHGLSYTRFTYGTPKAAVAADGGVSVQFSVRNSGKRAGADVAQVYVSPVNGTWEAPRRLGAFSKIELAPGASKTVSVRIDPRLLAMFDRAANEWRIRGGSYRISVGASSSDIRGSTTVSLRSLTLPSDWKPRPAGPARVQSSAGRAR